MYNFKNKRSYCKEYAPQHYTIVCTMDEFINEINHTQLNKAHYLIEVMRPVDPLTLFIPKQIAMQLTWANTVNEQATTIPIQKLDFKNNTLYIHKKYKPIISNFKHAKYWQIELLHVNIFVITAPKKPTIIFI